MKNWEKYEKEIKRIGVVSVAVSLNTRKPVKCTELSCDKCLLRNRGSECGHLALTDWLYSDYKEPVVLTDDERKLCELLGKGWIARDEDDALYYYQARPKKKEYTWHDCTRNGKISGLFPQCKFAFIKWEDEEPWEVKV